MVSAKRNDSLCNPTVGEFDCVYLCYFHQQRLRIKMGHFSTLPSPSCSSLLTVVSPMRSSSPPISLCRSQRLRGGNMASSSSLSLPIPRSHSRDWLHLIKAKTNLRATLSNVRTPVSSTSGMNAGPPTPPLPLQPLTRFSSSPLSSLDGTSSSSPSPHLGTSPAAPLQHTGQGPNGTSGNSLPVGTMCFSAAPSVGSIVVNTAPYQLGGPMTAGPPIPPPGTFWYSPTMPSAFDAGTRTLMGPAQPSGLDLVSSYIGLLIYFIS